MFGDELEAIRTFDPLTQRSHRAARRASRCKPVSEVLLDAASISRFRTGYRELFGAVSSDDPLYEAVSAGRASPAWSTGCRCSTSRLETLFDYLPGGAVTLDHQAEEAAPHGSTPIADYLRRAPQSEASRQRRARPVYKPLPPDRLYLDEADWTRSAGEPPRSSHLSPFQPPERRTADVVDAGGRPGRDFADAPGAASVNLFDAVRDHVRRGGRGRPRVLFAA